MTQKNRTKLNSLSLSLIHLQAFLAGIFQKQAKNKNALRSRQKQKGFPLCVARLLTNEVKALQDGNVVVRWRTHCPHGEEDEDERVDEDEPGHIGCKHGHVPRLLVVGHDEEQADAEGESEDARSEGPPRPVELRRSKTR